MVMVRLAGKELWRLRCSFVKVWFESRCFGEKIFDGEFQGSWSRVGGLT